MMRRWNLAEANYGIVKQDAGHEVAVLPFGATEPHNLHLPYGTDTMQVDVLADRICELAHKRGAKVIRLPTIPYGTETNQTRFPLSMNLNPTTLCHVITDLVASLATTGVRKCLLLNGHGGNDFKWILRQLHDKTPVHLFLCNWYRVGSDQHGQIFQDAGDHAGEMETSMMLAHHPALVSMEQADAGAMRLSRFEAVRNGWVEITRPWHVLTTNAGAGDPKAATAEKGAKLTDLVVDRVARFLVELSASPVDNSFPL